MTRRSIFNLFGLLPLVDRRLAGTPAPISPLCICARHRWIKEHTRIYNPETGDVGRGNAIPVAEIVELVPVLSDLGFSLYASYFPDRWSIRSEASYIRLLGAPGKVWFGFIRDRNQKHEIVAFETSQTDARDFQSAIGWTLTKPQDQATRARERWNDHLLGALKEKA